MKELGDRLGKNIHSKGNCQCSWCKGPGAATLEEQQEVTVAGEDGGVAGDKIRELETKSRAEELWWVG